LQGLGVGAGGHREKRTLVTNRFAYVQEPNTTPRLTRMMAASFPQLSRESSQRTAAEVEEQPVAPEDRTSFHARSAPEEEQGHSLGIGLAYMRYRRLAGLNIQLIRDAD
jgi:hypothetical protein